MTDLREVTLQRRRVGVLLTVVMEINEDVFTGGWKVSDMGVCAVISMYLYTLTAVYAIHFW